MSSPLRVWLCALTWASAHSCAVPCSQPPLPGPPGTYTILESDGDDRLLGGTIHIEGDDLTILFTDTAANQTYAVRYERNVADD